MGFFDKFKKSKDENINLLTNVIDGNVIDLSTVNDEVFSSGMMGVGVAVIPTGSRVVSPGPGVVKFVFPAKHAIGITLENGADIIIHVGINTVNMYGSGFESFVKEGTIVKRGDLLLKVDLELIKKAGYETTTMVIVTNKELFSDIKFIHGNKVTNETILELVK
jgi:PTS system sucrose-specific IIC component